MEGAWRRRDDRHRLLTKPRHLHGDAGHRGLWAEHVQVVHPNEYRSRRLRRLEEGLDDDRELLFPDGTNSNSKARQGAPRNAVGGR